MAIRLSITYCFFFWSLSSFGLQANASALDDLQNKNFELVKDVDNIRVYHKVERKKGYIEYKASTIVNESNMDTVLAFFENYTRHPQWVYNCIASRIKEQNGATYLYQICKSPWPMKNRDLSLKVESNKIDANTVEVNFISQPDALEKNTEHVRIIDFQSTWLVKQLKDKVLVTVYTSFDPKLSIGNFMLKSYATKIPFETLKNLKAQCHVKM